MKKIIILVIVVICCVCAGRVSLAVNPADTSVDYRLMPKLFCASYDENETRSLFAAFPIKDKSVITLFNRTKESEIKTCFTTINQFSELIDGGIKAELVQDRDSGDIELKQEIGVDFHKWIFGLGVVTPFQGNNTWLGARMETKYFVSYIHYETEEWWDTGLDIKVKRVKAELSYDDDEELYTGLSYDIITRWGSFCPKIFRDDKVWGGKIIFFPK